MSSTISALPDGTTANATDRIPIARSPFGAGTNDYITTAYIATYFVGLANTFTNTNTFAAILGASISLTGGATIFNATAISAGGTAGRGYKFSSTSNFGVFYGSGAPTLAAAQGSIYLRSDGTASTGLYTNTDGSTTWSVISSGGGGITIGTTTITSGTNTRILYDNSGVVGEYTLTGTGTVVAMQTSPSFLTGITTPIATITQGTITADAPQINGTVTWNNSGIVGPAWKLNVTDTSSNAAALLMDLQVGGTSQLKANKAGLLTIAGNFVIPNGHGLSNQGASSMGLNVGGSAAAQISIGGNLDLASGSVGWGGSGLGTVDLYLTRDAANTLAQRNGTNAQVFNLYNTYTDGSNYERIFMGWSSNICYLATTRAGTGSGRDLWVGVNGSNNLTLYTAGSERWTVNASGHFLAGTDNTYDIGASGANRPRSLYLGGAASVAGDISTNSSLRVAVVIELGTHVQFGAGADGCLAIYNDAFTGFSLLQFGGVSSSFPALKRDGVGLSMRLADDSAGTWFKVLRTVVGSLPSASTSGAGAFAIVSDALAPAIGSTVTGGGAIQCFVISDGTNWKAA